MATVAQENWSREEVEAVVADYLHMLTLELSGQAYSKTVHRKALLAKLNNRTDGSVERKHQNISAVLLMHGWPRISGYKPLGNFQQLLAEVIVERVKSDKSAERAAETAADIPAVAPIAVDFASVFVSPPKLEVGLRQDIAQYFERGVPALQRDFLAREARNVTLGSAGEEFVVELEARRLHQIGAKKLANRVEQVSKTKGDGLGFDVLSFEESGAERYIEVKTTTFGKETPFYISRNEVEFSKRHLEDFHLYRLFDFRKSPKLFDLVGPVDKACLLDPVSFVGRFS